MTRFLVFGASLLVLASCAAGPDYEPPQTAENVSDEWASAKDEKQADAVNEFVPLAVQQEVLTSWWEIFQDQLLNQYIEQASLHNMDVQIALANLRAARAARREAIGAFWPEIGSSAEASRTRTSEEVSSTGNGGNVRNSYDAGFDASWEIDIFGGTRRASEAAAARVGSATADYQGVMLSTLSEVARNYYEARGLQKRIAITEKNTELLRESFNLIKARLEAGEASEFDLVRARGEYQLTQARLPNLRGELRATLYRLSVLLGQPPEALLAEMEEVKPLPAPPDLVPVGLRSDILRRRPDVRFAERQLAASVADIGVAASDLFPKFFLTGSAASQALTFGDLFSSAAGAWSLAGLVDWPIFEGGSIRARIDIQKAESEAALAAYEQTVLEALADAETALTLYGRELETRRRLEEGVQSRLESVRLARQLFDAGEEDFLAVIDAERELTASEDDLVVSETQSIVKLIALFTSLGGGWERFGLPED